MQEVLLILTAIIAFAATNIDDLLILMMYFSNTKNNKNVVIGQYLGFLGILVLSFLGFLGSVIINSPWLGLIGVLPILIGINKLVTKKSSETTNKLFNVEILSLALITLANSGDNLGVYIPLFVNKSLNYVLTSISIFLVMVGVWCYLAYKITNHPKIKKLLESYGNKVIPWVLIMLGVFILINNGVLNLI